MKPFILYKTETCHVIQQMLSTHCHPNILRSGAMLCHFERFTTSSAAPSTQQELGCCRHRMQHRLVSTKLRIVIDWQLERKHNTRLFIIICSTFIDGTVYASLSYAEHMTDSSEKADAAEDWGQEEKGTIEDEVVGWHHQWTRVWGSSGSWWRIGKPGVLQPTGLQRQTRLSHCTDDEHEGQEGGGDSCLRLCPLPVVATPRWRPGTTGGLPEDTGCLQILSQQGMAQAKSCTHLDNYVFEIYADSMVINITFI